MLETCTSCRGKQNYRRCRTRGTRPVAEDDVEGASAAFASPSALASDGGPSAAVPSTESPSCTVEEPDGGEFTSRSRPPLESLYDVFVNIRNDEKEHWKTLCNLVQFDDLGGDAAGAPEATRPCVVVGDECFIEDECAVEPVLVASR